MKTGLVLEGGAMRGLFTAGALDYLLQQDFYFDYVIGVSAGANNGINFLSRQQGRCRKVISHENVVSYMGFDQFIRHFKVSNVEAMIKGYALNQFPFDFETFESSKTEFECVVINCDTGLPEYHGNFANREDFFNYNIATCSLPFFSQPIEIHGNHYLDGSLTDSIPLKRAMEKGCDKALIVLTKPEGGDPTNYGKLRMFLKMMYSKYPKLIDSMCRRVDSYEEQMAYIDQKVKEGRALIIRPEVQYVHHIDNSKKRMRRCYDHGFELMQRKYDEVTAFLKSEI